MIDTNSFAKLVPGFDFMQRLMQGGGATAPAMGQWVAPTLDPAEIEKRIAELKTVQFWLEQNARLIATTVQAMEVQRMTLATLQTMNLPMAELQKSMLLPEAPAQKAAKPIETPAEAPAEQAAQPPAAAPNKSRAKADATATPPAGVVDPMQWWGALTRQFADLASQALSEAQPAGQRAAAAAPAAAAKAPAAKKTAAKKAARR
jgi:hypothetical protein